MANATAVTKENLHTFEARLDQLVARKKKAKRFSKICSIVGSFVCMLCFLVVTCPALMIFMDDAEKEIVNQIPFIMPVWNEFVTLLPENLPLVVQLLIGCVAATVVPFVVNLLLRIILSFVPVKVEAVPEAESDLQKAKRLEKIANEANTSFRVDDTAIRIVAGALYAIAAVAIPCYTTYVLGGKQWEALLTVEVILVSLILSAVLLAVFLLINRMSGSLCEKLYSYKKDDSLNNAFSEYKKVCKKQEEIEKERQEQERKQREEEKRLAEKKKRREKGAELYAQATAGDVLDETLLEQAAQLGDPQASMIIGKRLLEKGLSDMYTEREKKGFMRQAAGYFTNSSGPEGTPEGTLLMLCCQVQYEKNDKAGWESILNQLRYLREHETFSEDNQILCDASIRALVSTIDDMVKNAPKPPREPQLKRKYCRYYGNGAICTYYSTGSYMGLCKYPNNPGQCAAALMEKAIVYEYE